MPLTALLAGATVLDASARELAAGIRWEQIHRVKPRAPLTCRGCGNALQAKVSKRGLRFFAHDRTTACPFSEETLEHRLLKRELASAVRSAGWHAELEVAGVGDRPWRADVLATSPDGTHRIALEAQLSAITPDEIAERHDNYTAAGVRACWVTTKFVPWLGRVPSWMLTRTADDAVTVELGVWRFVEQSWTLWEQVPTLTLADAVALLCNGQLVEHAVNPRAGVQVRGRIRELDPDHAHPHLAWTAPFYADQAADYRKRQALYQHNVEALAARQQALIGPTIELIQHQTGRPASVAHNWSATGHGWDEFWAMGVPVRSEGSRWVAAVICPVASRITPDIRARLRSVLVIVASDRELARLQLVCSREQRFRLIQPPHP